MRWSPRAATLSILTAVVVAGLVASGSNAAKPGGPNTAELTSPTLTGPNRLDWGVVEPDGHLMKLGNNHGGKTLQLSDIAVSYGDPPGSLVLYLQDGTCHATYYSDASGDADHVTLIPDSSTSTWHLQIGDAGPGCVNKATSVPMGTNNLDVYVPQSALKLPG